VNDEQLFAEYIASGSQAAFGELFARWNRRMIAYFWSCFRSVTTAEDLSQELFLRIHVHAKRFRFGSRFGTWLWSIAHNLAVSRSRERRRPIALAETDTGTWAVADAMLPEMSSLERDEIRNAVAELPAAHRDVIALTFGADASDAEAAARLGIPGGTIKSRKHRAIRLLRERLVA
jgi:RNA polymerase sigma-70 factor (ECF subfamily)